jgi:hypothetical protein
LDLAKVKIKMVTPVRMLVLLESVPNQGKSCPFRAESTTPTW